MRLLFGVIVHFLLIYLAFSMIRFDALGGVFMLFCGMYVVILFIVSRVFWKPLRDAFPSRPDRTSNRYYMINAYSGIWRATLNVAAGDAGLRLVPIPMFRLFHSPIHVPWSEVEVSFPKPRLTRIVFTNREFPDMYLNARIAVPLECVQESAGT